MPPPLDDQPARPPDEPPPGQPHPRRFSRRAAAAAAATLVGLGLTALLVHRVGARTLWERLLSVGPRAGLMLLAYLAGTFVGSLPFRWLLSRADRPDLPGTFAGRLSASALNVIIPGMGVLGEPARLAWMERSAWPAGVAAMLVDRVMFAGVSLALLAASLIGALALPGLSLDQRHGAVVGAAILVILCGLLFWRSPIAARRGAVERWVGAVERTLRRFRIDSPAGAGPGAVPFGVSVDTQVQRLVDLPRPRLLVCLLTSLLGRLLLAGEIVVGLYVLGAATTFWAALLLALLPVALSFTGGLVPGQLGIQEVAQVAVCQLVGIDPAAGLLVVLLQRARQVLMVPVAGGLLWARLAASRQPPGGPVVRRPCPTAS